MEVPAPFSGTLMRFAYFTSAYWPFCHLYQT